MTNPGYWNLYGITDRILQPTSKGLFVSTVNSNPVTQRADELKYAAKHYVEDTGIDNNMTSMFELIKEAEKYDPLIWEKMAKWFTSVSPIMAVETFVYNQKKY